MVGARRTTHYGQDTARKLAYQLAGAGITVVSGGARGIAGPRGRSSEAYMPSSSASSIAWGSGSKPR